MKSPSDLWEKAAEYIGSDGCTWVLDFIPECCWAHDWRWRHSPPRLSWEGVKWKVRSDVSFGECHIRQGIKRARATKCPVCAAVKMIGYPAIGVLYTIGVGTLGWVPWLLGKPGKVPPGRTPWSGFNTRDD